MNFKKHPIWIQVNCTMLALWVVFSIGCGRFNDYVAAPTIVDASARPPYITSPVEVPQVTPAPIYPLPRQESEASEIPAIDFSDSSLTVVADPLEDQQDTSKNPVGLGSRSRHQRILYEYDPSHPAANEHGYIEIVNPVYDDQSNAFSGSPGRSRELVPVESKPVELPSQPTGEFPRVTNVAVIGAEPPALEMLEKTDQNKTRQAVSDSTGLVSGSGLSVKGQHDESVNLQEKLDSLAVQELFSQNGADLQKMAGATPELTASRSTVLPVPTATIEELQQLIRANPDDTQKQLSLRFLYLAYNQKEKALELFPSVAAEKQAEAITIVRAAMLTAQAGEPERPGQTDRANRALEALSHLKDMMAEQADLEVAYLEICQDQSVKGFGQYEPLAQNLLTTGEPRTVQIYCELKHFKSQLNPEGKYVTHVAASIELVDEDYRTIYQLPKSEIPDVPSYHPRRDFFFRGQIRLPKLAPGKYEIVARVEDKFAGKIARPFRKAFEVKAPARERP